MPKNKKESDSDSSSGPEDRAPAKKSKQSSSSSTSISTSRALKNPEGETYFELDRFKRVSVRTFKGKLYVDIREFFEKDNKILPGKKGISMTAELWQKLQKLIPEINEAVRDAV